VYPYSSGFSPQDDRAAFWSPYPYTGQMMYVLHVLSNVHERHCISMAEFDLKNIHRLLWEQHVYWTRMTIMGIVMDLPDLQFVEARLLRNSTEMGNFLRPFYGNQIADAYAKLINVHLRQAAELVTAAAKGDTKKAAELEKQWYQNADRIAVFLSSINPYLSIEAIREMFYEHLALTKQEAVYMIQKNYKASIEVFEKIEAEALEMADAISDGIVQQFPNQFMTPC
jgi:hypothetical protein